MEHLSPKEDKPPSFCILYKQILPKACLLVNSLEVVESSQAVCGPPHKANTLFMGRY